MGAMLELKFPDRPVLRLDPARGPALMGILNLTPDSFSDPGRFPSVDAALRGAEQMVEEGADILDVGGESTRPGARPVDGPEQKRRVVGAIQAIHRRLPQLPISIDTTRSDVAAGALDVGACMINDVSAGRHDAGMLRLAAARGVPIVLMHMRGEPATMQNDPTYRDVVREVKAFLDVRADAARAAGLHREQIVLDPGIGFGKKLEHNLALLANPQGLLAMGHPVLLGASRKRFISDLCADAPSPEQRIGGTCAVTALAVQTGVHLVRVHDVAANFQARSVMIAVRDAAATKKGKKTRADSRS